MEKRKEDALLEVSGLTKSFAGNTVLRDVSFSIHPGEFHALVGENGAGKSTLVNLISGVHQPDSGTIAVNSKTVEHMVPQKAVELGISVVHQELSLFPHLSIAQNIFLQRELRGKGGILRQKEMNRITAGLLEEVGLSHLSPEEEIGHVLLAEQQLIEFIKTMFQQPSLLILDEATSALDPKQVATMFGLLQKRRETDKLSIIFITHRLGEVFDLCGDMTVLKDGAHVVTRELAGATVDDIVRYMTGRKIENLFPPKADNEAIYQKEKALELFDVSTNNLRGISFALYKSEILGIGGLQGQGQQELMEAMFGVMPLTNGYMEMGGKRVHLRHSTASMEQGMAYLPSDRATESLFLGFSVKSNIGFANLDTISNRFGTVNSKAEEKIAEEGIQRFSIKLADMNQEVVSLSGGNQQKVVLAKWLTRNPQVLLLNDPTRGIDVGTKKEIYDILRGLSAEGVSIIMVSSDTIELLGLCDRVVVLYEHQLNGELRGGMLTEENLVYVSVVKQEANN